MNMDETWLYREVEEQVQDELEYYRHALKMIKEELFIALIKHKEEYKNE